MLDNIDFKKIAETILLARHDKNQPVDWKAIAEFILILKDVIKKALDSEDSPYKRVEENGELRFKSRKYARNWYYELGRPFCKQANLDLDLEQFTDIVKMLNKSGIAELSDDIAADELCKALLPSYIFENKNSRTILKSVLSAGLAEARPVVMNHFVKPFAIGYAANCTLSAVINSSLNYAINGTFSSPSLPPILPPVSAPVFFANLAVQKIVKPSSFWTSMGLSCATSMATNIAVNYACPAVSNLEIPCAPITTPVINSAIGLLLAYRHSIARKVSDIGSAVTGEMSRIGNALVKASQALDGYDDEPTESPTTPQMN